jgi:hypothetical protein
MQHWKFVDNQVIEEQKKIYRLLSIQNDWL